MALKPKLTHRIPLKPVQLIESARGMRDSEFDNGLMLAIEDVTISCIDAPDLLPAGSHCIGVTDDYVQESWSVR